MFLDIQMPDTNHVEHYVYFQSNRRIKFYSEFCEINKDERNNDEYHTGFHVY